MSNEVSWNFDIDDLLSTSACLMMSKSEKPDNVPKSERISMFELLRRIWKCTVYKSLISSLLLAFL